MKKNHKVVLGKKNEQFNIMKDVTTKKQESYEIELTKIKHEMNIVLGYELMYSYLDYQIEE